MSDADFLAEVQKRFPRYVDIGKVTGRVRIERPSPAWDFLREIAWERDGHKCKNCYTPVDLQKGLWSSVHCAHYGSRGAGHSDVPSNVRSLCNQCHADEHSGKEVG